MRNSFFTIAWLASLILVSCNPKPAPEPTIASIPVQAPPSTDLPSPTKTVISINTPSLIPTDLPERSEIYNISASPDGRLLALSASFGVQVYSLADGRILYSFEREVLDQFQGIYSYIAWSPDGTDLAVGKPVNGIRIWDVTTWSLLSEKDQNEKSKFEYPGFAWSPDGSQLALGVGKGEILIWDKKTNTWDTKTAYTGKQFSITWSSGGQLLAMNDRGLYDVNTGELLTRLDPDIDDGYAYAVWSPDTRHVYIFFDLGGGMMDVNRNKYDGFGSCCYSEVAWSMDGRYFAATPERSNEISVWDTEANNVIERKKQGDAIYAFAWLPDGELLAAGLMNGNDVLWNTNTGKVLITLER